MEFIDIALTHPFSMLVAGGRGAGKTEFVKKLLRFRFAYLTPPPDRVVWCYTKLQQKLYQELLNINPEIEYVLGIPTNLEEMFDASKNNLIVLDDMMDEGADDKRISQLFTRGRHDNLSVIFLTQNLFHQKQRAISLNSDYIVVFKNPRDQSQFSNLAKQVLPKNHKFLQWAYSDATKNPHSYIFLDLRATTNENHRIRSNVIPSEDSLYSKIQYLYTPHV